MLAIQPALDLDQGLSGSMDPVLWPSLGRCPAVIDSQASATVETRGLLVQG